VRATAAVASCRSSPLILFLCAVSPQGAALHKSEGSVKGGCREGAGADFPRGATGAPTTKQALKGVRTTKNCLKMTLPPRHRPHSRGPHIDWAGLFAAGRALLGRAAG